MSETASANRYSTLADVNAERGKVQSLAKVRAEDVPRRPTGIGEFDRVLGGGLVDGGVVLIGGDPGIGKSTLLLQALANLSRSKKVLYVSGEESGHCALLCQCQLNRPDQVGLATTAAAPQVSWHRRAHNRG